MEKPETSKLAIATLITPAALWIMGTFCYPVSIALFSSRKGHMEGLLGLLPITGVCLLLSIVPVTVILFFVSFHKIKKSNGGLKGKRYAIEGIILVFGLIALTVLLFLIYF